MRRSLLVVLAVAGSLGGLRAQMDESRPLEFERTEITMMDVVSALQRGGIRANIELPAGALKEIPMDDPKITLGEILKLAKETFEYDYRKDARGFTFYSAVAKQEEAETADFTDRPLNYLDQQTGKLTIANATAYDVLRLAGQQMGIGIVSPRYARNPDGNKVTFQGESYTLRQALDEIAWQAGFMGWCYSRSEKVGMSKPVVVVYFGLYWRGFNE